MIVSFKISECAQNFCAPHICFLSVIVYLFNHYNSCIFHLCAISLRSLMIMALHNYLVAITNSCLFAISIKPCSITNSPSSIFTFNSSCEYQILQTLFPHYVPISTLVYFFFSFSLKLRPSSHVRSMPFSACISRFLLLQSSSSYMKNLLPNPFSHR